MSLDKIKDLSALGIISAGLKKLNKRIILCHGTFDLMHTGHIRYFQRAKDKGDILIVTVTSDFNVLKGPGRPYFSDTLRAESIAALSCVDYVGINYSTTAVEPIEKIRPFLYVKGDEYSNTNNDLTGNIDKEINEVKKYGGNIFYTNEIVFSSSSIINQFFDSFSEETRQYLNDFSKKYSVIDVHNKIDGFCDLKVLVIGDAIIDQYCYVNPLGQTGKGNVLSVQYSNEEQFAGGALAVANHIAGFVDNIDLFTGIGSHDSHESFIRDKLNKKINLHFQYFINSPTITKKRFVDNELSKFFEIYYYDEFPKIDNSKFNYLNWLSDNLKKYDLVIVADFGNGFVTQDMRDSIIKNSKFLAVNTQVNSGNRGYHVINQYSKANFVSLNEPEIRLSAHNKIDKLTDIIIQTSKLLDVNNLAVTKGTNGATIFNSNEDCFYEIPALSSKVIDRIGAGDAFLSFASMSLAMGYDSRLSLFLGSVGAAMDVQIVCNREPIDFVNFKKYITTLLK